VWNLGIKDFCEQSNALTFLNSFFILKTTKLGQFGMCSVSQLIEKKMRGKYAVLVEFISSLLAFSLLSLLVSSPRV